MDSTSTTLQDEEDDQPLDITPMAETMSMMDPYELFSTPPSEMVLSSTPSKPAKCRQFNRRGAKAPGSARKAVLNKRLANRASLSFDSGHMVNAANTTSNTSFSSSRVNNTTNTTKSTRVLRNRNVNKSRIIDDDEEEEDDQIETAKTKPTTKPTKTTRTKQNTKSNKQRPNQQSKNLWDKCLKSNPELAQFVDNFNHSLEEALSKPLDMSGNE